MTETASAPAVVLDDFGKQAVARLIEQVNTRNEKAGTLQAANGDAQGLLEALRVSSDNPDVVSINEQLMKLQDQLLALETKRDEILAPVVADMKANAATKVEPLMAEVDELDKSIRVASNYIKQMYGPEALADVPHLVGRKGRTADGHAGGTKRVRGFDVYVDGAIATLRNGKGEDTSNLAAAAKVLGVETATVQQAFFTAQGTQDSKDYKDRVEFEITVEDVTHKVVAQRASAAAGKDDED